MEKKWDGKTKGSLWGYKFFILCIRIFGIWVSYFFCFFVATYFVLFAKKQRNALIKFYQKGFQFSKSKSIWFAARNFNLFGRILIDRLALKTIKRKHYTQSFDNEKALVEMNEAGKGGFLFSGHVGNWENAGNLIGERITSKINILMLDDEVEKIKNYIENSSEEAKFKLIPLKNDMSHLILIHRALKKNELIALHADRTLPNQKTFQFDFLNGKAEFPAGPFIMAHKFKVPITFVFAVKGKGTHYNLCATDLMYNSESPEQIAEAYVNKLEQMVVDNPIQWFNFYDYYVN
jgi:predicted LPLAT superfamily acyltransferase